MANLEKALALDPHSSNNDKWNSLLKVNRYWLAIQQGDAALKANNPDRAERLFQQARNVDNTDSYAVLGLGDVAMARKDYPAAERYYQQTLRMDSGNTNAVRGLANIYRQQSPEKAEAFIASLSPASGAALMISNAACKTTVWHSRQRHWKTRANGRRRQHFSGNDWRWTPAAYGLLTDFRRISGRPDNAARLIR